MLQAYLFGGFNLESDGHPLPTIPSLAARSLLAYLLTYRQRSHTRTLLVGLFWPDLPEATARRRLSHALWEIRRTLGSLSADQPCLLTGHESVRFNLALPHWIDVAEFEQALAVPAESLRPDAGQSAVTLYRGDFLAGFYEDWVLLERERLRDQYLAALSQLVERSKGQGRYETALGYAAQLARYDPLREEAHREVMRLYFLLNRPREALQQYLLCRDLLLEELGSEPGAATTRLFQEIQQRLALEPAGIAEPTSRLQGRPLFKAAAPPMVGRQREQATLIQAMEQTLSGRGSFYLIDGEPGVGKTRLLQVAGEDAAWRGLRLLWAPGRELDQNLPYAPLREALATTLTPLRTAQLAELLDDLWLRELSRIMPALAERLPEPLPRPGPASPGETPRVREALIQALLALAQLEPLLLILDNLQWTDEATFDVLLNLLPHLPAQRLLVIAALQGEVAHARPEIAAPLAALLLPGRGTCLSLARLGEEDAAELVRQTLGLPRPAPRFESRIYRQSGGNPLFALEMLNALRDEGLLCQDEQGEWHTPWDTQTKDYAELPLAPVLQEVMAGRLRRLEATTRTMLQAAAVLGEPLSLPAWLQTGNVDRPTALAAIAELLRRGFLVEDGDSYRFSHAPVQRITYQMLPAGERQQLHQQAAQALRQEQPGHFAALAHHFTAGHCWAEAVHYHRLAGQQAAEVHAYAPALRHFAAAQQAATMLAAANTPLAPAGTFDLLAEQEAALNVLARREAQAATLAEMAQLATAAELPLPYHLRLARRQAGLLMETGRYAAAEAEVQAALAVANRLAAPANAAAQAHLYQLLGNIRRDQGHYQQAIPDLERAIALCQQVGEPAGECQARLALGNVLQQLGRFGQAQQELSAALALTETTGDLVGQADVLALLGVLQRKQGDLDGAEAYYQESLQLSQATGYALGEARSRQNLATLLYYRGQIGAALAMFDQTVAIAQQIGHRSHEALARSNAASIRIDMLGDVARAEADVTAALAYARESGDRSREAHALGTLAEIARRRGDLPAAEAALEEALGTLAAREEQWSKLQLQRTLALVYLDDGRGAAALALLTGALAECRALGLVDLAVSLQALRGKALLALSRPGEALGETAAAVTQVKPGVEQAYLVYFWHAEVLLALSRPGEAQPYLQQAYNALQAVLQGLSAGQRRQSLEMVAEHQAIVAAWGAVRGRQVEWALPRVGVPTGRALRPEEWVTVTWTVATPEDDRIVAKGARRRQQLLRLLAEAAAQGGAPRVTDLAAVLNVTPKTIKRDLATLRGSGQAVTTRGSRPA